MGHDRTGKPKTWKELVTVGDSKQRGWEGGSQRSCAARSANHRFLPSTSVYNTEADRRREEFSENPTSVSVPRTHEEPIPSASALSSPTAQLHTIPRQTLRHTPHHTDSRSEQQQGAGQRSSQDQMHPRKVSPRGATSRVRESETFNANHSTASPSIMGYSLSRCPWHQATHIMGNWSRGVVAGEGDENPVLE